MIEFISANWANLLIGLIVFAVIAVACFSLYWDRKKGVSCSSCGSGCSGCVSKCPYDTKENKIGVKK